MDCWSPRHGSLVSNSLTLPFRNVSGFEVFEATLRCAINLTEQVLRRLLHLPNGMGILVIIVFVNSETNEGQGCSKRWAGTFGSKSYKSFLSKIQISNNVCAILLSVAQTNHQSPLSFLNGINLFARRTFYK